MLSPDFLSLISNDKVEEYQSKIKSRPHPPQPQHHHQHGNILKTCKKHRNILSLSNFNRHHQLDQPMGRQSSPQPKNSTRTTTEMTAHEISNHSNPQDLHLHLHLSSPSDQYLKLRSVSIDLINQAIGLLHNVITTDQSLTSVSQLVPGSTIGKHLRHLHDHFRLLFEASCASQISNNSTINSSIDRPQRITLNYDSRQRNVPMESSRKVMIIEFENLKRLYLENESSRLNQGLNDDDHHHQLPFNHNLELDLIAITPSKVQLQTSFNRELWFACLHATHHFALIRVIVTGELNLKLPKEFGVAPSTLERSSKI